jgi:hypothetical protein
MSRRYLNLDGWEALLRRFAGVAGRDFDYYYSTADGRFPAIATQIAADLHESFWNDDEYEDLREQFRTRLRTPESALKALVADYVSGSLEALPEEGPLAHELDLFKKVVVDGVLTTNYDSLIEHLFPSFEVFVGQDRLLFSEPQGVAEVYKIHGSHEEPDSLVLTERDYALFRKRNPYLAAKLLTIFVEHPTVFLGYRLADPNVTELLHSIAVVLTNDRLAELQDRLLFVQWEQDAEVPSLTGTSIAVGDGMTIPVRTVTISSYNEIFVALGQLQRKFPARLLRHLKEQVYELVRDNDPQGRLFVQDLEADADLAQIDVVLGVGIKEKLTQSYRGLTRHDLFNDLIDGGQDLRPRRVVEDVIGPIQLATYVPVYKYLREAGALDQEGNIKDAAWVPERVRRRVEESPPRFRGGPYENAAKAAVAKSPTLARLRAAEDDYHVMQYLFELPQGRIYLSTFRKFLEETRDEFLSGVAGRATFWARAACYYDYLKYGKQLKARTLVRRASKKKPKK